MLIPFLVCELQVQCTLYNIYYRYSIFHIRKKIHNSIYAAR